jgi:hypothetical protein
MVNGTEQPKILDAKGAPAEQIQEQKPDETVSMQITVTMFESGRVLVNGAVQNKMLAYGLLDVAKDVVRAHVDGANAPRVQPAPGFFRSLLDKRKHASATRR